MHEIEALYFSAPEILARGLGVERGQIEEIIDECKEPENINDQTQTAPSKRLDGLSGQRFRKTAAGIAIASEIGIPQMRLKCPIFNGWLDKLESLA